MCGRTRWTSIITLHMRKTNAIFELWGEKIAFMHLTRCYDHQPLGILAIVGYNRTFGKVPSLTPEQQLGEP